MGSCLKLKLAHGQCCDFASRAAEGVLRVHDKKNEYCALGSRCLKARDKSDVVDNFHAAQNCRFLGFRINHYWPKVQLQPGRVAPREGLLLILIQIKHPALS